MHFQSKDTNAVHICLDMCRRVEGDFFFKINGLSKFYLQMPRTMVLGMEEGKQNLNEKYENTFKKWVFLNFFI